jgi:myosin-crossreactive antigen
MIKLSHFRGSLHGIMRTVYNQYDSLVRPLQKWLLERGVEFSFDIYMLLARVARNGDTEYAQRHRVFR